MAFIPDTTDYTDLVLNHLLEYQKISQSTHTLLRRACDTLPMDRRSDTTHAFSLVINTLAEILLCWESEVKRLTKENEEMKNRIQDLTESKSHRIRVMENTSE